MGHEYHLAELKGRLAAARERLAHERLTIFEQFPLATATFDKTSREAYGFAYLRAERLGMKAIKRRMDEVSWLPARVDASSELSADTREKLARWVRQGTAAVPDMHSFGNEFFHTLTRCLIVADPDSAAFRNLADRIALLFRDLAYLVAAIHCCNLFKELGVDRLHLTAPQDLGKIALDLIATLESLTVVGNEESPDVTELAPANESAAPYLRLVPPVDEGDGATV